MLFGNWWTRIVLSSWVILEFSIIFQRRLKNFLLQISISGSGDSTSDDSANSTPFSQQPYDEITTAINLESKNKILFYRFQKKVLMTFWSQRIRFYFTDSRRKYWYEINMQKLWILMIVICKQIYRMHTNNKIMKIWTFMQTFF